MMENRREYSGLIILTVLGTLLLGTRAQQQQIEFVGNDVTLVPQYTREIKEIMWRINKTLMVEMKLNPPEEIKFKLPRDRFSINGTNGALTIRNLNINDSGNYMAEAFLKNDTAHNTEIKLIVHEYIYKPIIAAGVNSSATIIIIIIAVAVLLYILYKRSQKKKKIKQRISLKPTMSDDALLDEDTHEVNMAERI